jgi:tetratricopeptide (TPR) repeat protein
METYTLRGIESMLGLSKAVIASLVASGFVSPTRGQRNEYRFTFQDVVLLRTAYGLQRANIPARKILRSLKRLKETLPNEVPLSGLRITAVGSEIAVQDGAARRHVDSGQLLFDFDVQPAGPSITILQRPEKGVPMEPRGRSTDSPAAAQAPEHWFNQGSLLEAEDKTQAEAAYRRAIRLAPDYADAYLNLVVLMCDGGRCAEAVTLYREALRRVPDEALLHFNLAVALEDLERNDEALASYEACLRIAPKLADAHYNAARLHELSGHRSQAIRHYSEYRRLQR